MQSACMQCNKWICCDLEAKGIVPFPCHVKCKTHLLLLACAPFLALTATSIVQYSKFWIAKVFLWQPAMDKCEACAWSTTNAFLALTATSIVQYSKFWIAKAFLWQPAMDRCEAGAWSTTNEFATGRLGRLKFSTIQCHSKRHCSFSLSCEL